MHPSEVRSDTQRTVEGHEQIVDCSRLCETLEERPDRVAMGHSHSQVEPEDPQSAQAVPEQTLHPLAHVVPRCRDQTP